MLQKAYRLSKSSSFTYIYRHGKSVSCKELVLLYAPTKFNLKVGFSVSKKVGKSVVRNKTKRRLREAFRSLLPYVNRKHNYIVLARNDAAAADYRTLRRALINTLTRAGLLDVSKRKEYEEGGKSVDTLLQKQS